MYFIGRTSRGEPFLTGDKSGVTKFQLNLWAQCELQSRFVGSLINASTEAFCFLVAKDDASSMITVPGTPTWYTILPVRIVVSFMLCGERSIFLVPCGIENRYVQ